MHPQPLLAVGDVEATSRWYQQLLGLTSDHGGREYERLLYRGTLVLQLHHWGVDHHHGPIGDPHAKPYGNGVLLWFETSGTAEFDEVELRAIEMNVEFLLPKVRNPPDGKGGPNHWELWLRDPNGYKLVVASPYDSAGPA